MQQRYQNLDRHRGHRDALVGRRHGHARVRHVPALRGPACGAVLDPVWRTGRAPSRPTGKRAAVRADSGVTPKWLPPAPRCLTFIWASSAGARHTARLTEAAGIPKAPRQAATRTLALSTAGVGPVNHLLEPRLLRFAFEGASRHEQAWPPTCSECRKVNVLAIQRVAASGRGPAWHAARMHPRPARRRRRLSERGIGGRGGGGRHRGAAHSLRSGFATQASTNGAGDLLSDNAAGRLGM